MLPRAAAITPPGPLVRNLERMWITLGSIPKRRQNSLLPGSTSVGRAPARWTLAYRTGCFIIFSRPSCWAILTSSICDRFFPFTKFSSSLLNSPCISLKLLPDLACSRNTALSISRIRPMEEMWGNPDTL